MIARTASSSDRRQRDFVENDFPPLIARANNVRSRLRRAALGRLSVGPEAVLPGGCFLLPHQEICFFVQDQMPFRGQRATPKTRDHSLGRRAAGGYLQRTNLGSMPPSQRRSSPASGLMRHGLRSVVVFSRILPSICVWSLARASVEAGLADAMHRFWSRCAGIRRSVRQEWTAYAAVFDLQHRP